MRVQILIPTVLIIGGYLAACSKPVNQTNQDTKANDAPAARDIGLPEAIHPDAPVVSELEAGQALKPALVRRAARTKDAPKRALTAVTPPVTADAPVLSSAAPTLSRTTSSTAEAAHLLAMAPAPTAVVPAAATQPLGIDGRSWRSGGGYQTDQPEAGGLDRGPAIIIRGGRGGVDDRCDIHGHGVGLAINRVSPGLPRTGIR